MTDVNWINLVRHFCLKSPLLPPTPILQELNADDWWGHQKENKTNKWRRNRQCGRESWQSTTDCAPIHKSATQETDYPPCSYLSQRQCPLHQGVDLRLDFVQWMWVNMTCYPGPSLTSHRIFRVLSCLSASLNVDIQDDTINALPTCP